MIKVENLSVRIDQHDLLHNVNFEVKANEWCMIIGPNGSGKSTLLTSLLGLHRPMTGQVMVDGFDLLTLPNKLRAQKLGILFQSTHVQQNYTVEDIVKMGGYTQSLLNFFTSRSLQERIEQALTLTALLDYRHQRYANLSGGERQRVFLAQLFVQNPNIILLDEPLNHLDLYYQQSLLSILDEWRRGSERAIISVMHDLAVTKEYGDKVLLLDRGKVKHYGSSHDVMTSQTLNDVFRIDVGNWLQQLNHWHE